MSYVNTIERLGDKATLDGLIDGTLTEFVDDSIATIHGSSLKNKIHITLLDFKALNKIPAGAFDSTSLTSLILRRTSRINLDNKSAFNDTPIADGTGYIYVPRALVDSYKTATNWSVFANQFRALED